MLEMNLPAIIGFIVGAMILIYFVRMFVLFLFKKFLNASEDKKSKNLALIISVIFCTMLRYIIDEFSTGYIIGGFLLFLLGLIPDKKGNVENAN